jgi:hypothetical protein
MLLEKPSWPNDLTENRRLIPKQVITEDLQGRDSPPMVDLVIR